MAFNVETRQKAYPALDPYTASDSGFIEEAAYNKSSGRKGVLVGNWWEQDALERENEELVRGMPLCDAWGGASPSRWRRRFLGRLLS